MVGEGDTWTHFLFHFLTGPLKTVAVADRPYRDEVRPIRDPTPSIIFSPQNLGSFFGFVWVPRYFSRVEDEWRVEASELSLKAWANDAVSLRKELEETQKLKKKQKLTF
jgi:hypothetical protein